MKLDLAEGVPHFDLNESFYCDTFIRGKLVKLHTNPRI